MIAIAPAIRICRRTTATLSSTSLRSTESTVTHRGAPFTKPGIEVSPILRPLTRSTELVTWPLAAAAAAPG
jgi:hypothetical protein